jgi:hypothetical protein
MTDNNQSSELLDAWNKKRKQYNALSVSINALEDYQQVLVTFETIHHMWMYYRLNETINQYPVSEQLKKEFQKVEFNSSMFQEVYTLVKPLFDLLMNEDCSSLRFVHSKNREQVFLLEKYLTEFHGGFCAFNQDIDEILEKNLGNDIDKSILIIGFLKLEPISNPLN